MKMFFPYLIAFDTIEKALSLMFQRFLHAIAL